MQHPYPTPHVPRHSNNNPTPPGFSPRHMQCHSYQQQCLYIQLHAPQNIPPARFTPVANHLIANNQPLYHPPQNMHLSTLDINLKNIREWEILDSGASSHFLVIGAPVTNKQVAVAPISDTLTDGDQVHSTHKGDLDMTQFPKSARVVSYHPRLGIILTHFSCQTL